LSGAAAGTVERLPVERFERRIVNQIIIRQAVAADVPSVCLLQTRWFEEGNVYGFVPDGEQEVEAALGPYFLVAEVGGETVGFISGSAHKSEGSAVMPVEASYLEIDNLYVSPEFRRLGIGGGLLTRLLKRARQQGLAYALLYSAAKDIQGVLRFYEEHNFQSWYIRMFQKL
jgi:ribosomal protein S18 acetylase RimI-like enzyme